MRWHAGAIGLLLGVTTVGGPARGGEPAVPAFPPGATAETVRVIKRGLEFLKREQGKDGSLRSAGRFGSYPVSMTALGGLAFMASGSTPVRGPYAPQVRGAVKFCLSQQRPNGVLAAMVEEAHSMYGHGFAMLLLSQAYGAEEDKAMQRRLRVALRRAIQLTARAQSGDGGWDYTPDSRRDEGSVTITQVQALRACRNAGLHVPRQVIDRAIRYLERSQRADGGIAYDVRGATSLPAISAAACAVLYNAGKFDSPMAERCFAYAWRTNQPQVTGRSHYLYSQLYLSQAAWQRGDKYWNQYYPAVQRVLARLQAGNGSWKGEFVGPVYGTAAACLILQVPFNHLPILSR